RPRRVHVGPFRNRRAGGALTPAVPGPILPLDLPHASHGDRRDRMDWSRVQGPVRRELAQVDRQLAMLFRSRIGILNQVAGHFLPTRGKKFRPTLLLLVARLSGKADRDVVAAACVVEIIHAAALIHDDSVDKSLLRRGLPTVNHLWNDEVAIIIGDFLY